MADGGGAGSLTREGGGSGRAEWLRIYDRMVAILRKNHRHVEALLADRSRLEALLKVQHHFWAARDRLLRGSLHETERAEACARRCDEARLELLLEGKDRELRRYQIYAKHQDDDLEDFKTCAVALAEENTKLKLKLEEVENSAELSEKTAEHEHSGAVALDFVSNVEHQDDELEEFKTCAVALAEENTKLKLKLEEVKNSAELSEKTAEHEHSGRNWRAEIRELKKAYKNLSSKKDKEVSALLAEKDFVWNQCKTMEKYCDSLLEKKTTEAAQATEAAQKLQWKVDELQEAAQKNDEDISRLQAECNVANKKILLLENKLQKLHSLASEEDEKAQKLKGGHLQASQKRKQDINGTHRKCRSEGASVRGKSKNNPRRQMVEDQPETSQKRQCASSLSNGVDLRRRMHLKPAGSPAPQQVLFHSSFKVPKLKTPTPPPPPLQPDLTVP